MHAENPVAFRETVDKASQDAKYYIDGKTFAETLAQRDVEEARESPDVLKKRLIERMSPELREKVADAITRGGDVVMTPGEFLTAFGNTPEGKALQQHIRFNDPEAMTAAEAEKVDIDKLAKDAEKQVDEQQKAAEQWTQEAQEVERGIYEQVVAAGRKPDEAKADAQLWRSFVETQAERLQETPKQFADRYRVEVGKGDVPDAALEQSDAKTDSPEFKAWFGDSKVVDKDGKPLVVYHGSNITFSTFDDERIGSSTDRGKLGKGFYFSEDAAIASAYANLARAKRGMSGPQVYPVALSLKNPLVIGTERGDLWTKLRALSREFDIADDPVVDAESNSPNPEWSAAFSAALRKNGNDGVILDFGAGRREYMVLEPTQIKSVNNRGTFDPNDPNILRQEGGATRGGFSRSGNVLRITLTPDANASTFIHEGAHAFLEIYGDLANEKAHPAILDDFRKLLQWGGVKDEAAWKAMTIDQRRGMHERFAREFEAFVWEGKEPSAGLKGLFARLMRFLRRVYDNLRAIPEAQGVPDDIRAVMERMLASEQEVQVAQSIRGAVPLFQTQEESGLDDAAWAKHVERQKAADEAAVDEVVRSDLRNMKWLRLQVGRMQAENRKEVARLREGERQKVAAEIERQPIYRAIRWLKTGEMVNPDGTKTNDGLPHKLNREAVRDLLGLKELDENAEPAPVKEPKIKRGPSLVTRIKQLGGISAESWKKSWPGERKGEFRIPFMVRTNGMPWDYMARQLQAEGYGPQKGDADGVGSGDDSWLVDALADSSAGVPQYSRDLSMGERETPAGPNLPPESAEEKAARLEAERIDAEQERARMAAIQVAKPEKALHKLKGMLAEKGYAPDDVAQLFEIETGEELVRGILEAPPLLDAIEARTDEVMLEKHTDLMDPRKRDATIERALHNETRRRFVASELDALMKAQQPARVMLAAAKKAAEVALSTKRVKEINPRAFTMAARRSSMDAAEAQKAGKLDEAIAAKRREMVQSEMALLAMDVQKEVAKAEALFKGAERSDKDLAKSRDIDYVYALRSLGAKFGFREPIEAGQRTELTNTALAKLVDERPDLASRLATLSSLAAGGLKYRDVALSLFREVADLSEVLWTAARDAQILLADGKRRKVSEAVEALVGQVGSLPPPNSTKALPLGGDAPPWRSAMLKFWNVLAATKRMESVAWWLDGNKVGPFTRLIVQPIVKAEAKRNAAKAKMVAAVHADLMKVKEAAGAAWLAKIHSKELDYTFANKSELLRAMLYMGTDSGARKWLLGEKGKNGQTLGDLVPDADGAMVLDTSRWDRFIAKKWNDGTLTKADADFLKAMWGHFRDLLPQAQAVHKASTGFEYETLAERPMVTPFGTLEGGYVPVRADYDKAKPTPNYLKLDDIGKQRENIGFSIGTERGFSLKRNENYLQPLSLDLGKLLAHLDEELTFIHMELPVRDVARIAQGSMEVQNPDGTTSKVKLLDVLNGYDRTILPNVMQPWLENVALQRTTRPTRYPALDRAATWLRKVSSLSRLASNVTNSLLQATGISVAATQVPRSFVWSALSTVLKNPAAAVRDMLANSEAMRVKNDVETTRLQQDMARLNLGSVRGGIKAAQQFAGAVGFWLTRKVQSLADVVTWQAAKAHAEAGGADLEAAVQAADGAVRRSQGDNNPSGLAAFEVQTPAIQLLFQFGTYSNTILNTLMASRSRASAVVWAVLIPALVESLLRQAVRPPEDDDWGSIIDEMPATYANTLARSVAGLVPLVGPTALAALKSEGMRVQDAPAVSTFKDAVAGLYALVEAMGGDETTAAEWRKIAVLLTSVTQIPVAAPTGLAQDLAGAGAR